MPSLRFSAPARGAAWMMAAGVCFVMTGALVRHLNQWLSIFELAFIRALVILIILSPFILRSWGAGFGTRQPWVHVARAVLTYLGMMCWFYAVATIPLSEVAALQFTLPFFTILLAALFLKERVGRVHIAMTLTGFIGALIILRPGLVEVSLASIGALATALLYGGVNVCVRQLSTTDSTVTIMAVVNILLVPLAAVPAALTWVWPGPDLLPWLGLLALITTGSQLCITRAITLAEARVVQPFDFVRLPVSAVMGWLAFGETTDLWTWVGAVVIFASAYYVLFHEGRARRARPPAE